MKRPLPEDPVRRNVLIRLRKAAREHNAPIWRRVFELLNLPRRRRIAVNVSKINRCTEEGDTVVVPGKVLGAGFLDHPVTVAAYAFSEKAKKKIEEANGRCLSILELLEENPKGSGVKIIV